MPKQYSDDEYGEGIYGGKARETFLDGVLGDLLDFFPWVHPREPEKTFPRYVTSHQREIETLAFRFQDVKESHRIATASGQDLDHLGSIFGVLGHRRGRDDEEYRRFLQSLRQGFIGRGTVPGLKFAVAAGLNVQPAEVDIIEDFTENNYDISLDSWPAHRMSTLTQLADMADPSAVQMGSVRYVVDEQVAAVRDDATVKEDAARDDTATIGDTVESTAKPPGSFRWDVDNWDFAEWG